MNQPILTCRNVCFSYHNLSGETQALRNISFQIREGEFVAVVGPSGCGNATVRKRKFCLQLTLKNPQKTAEGPVLFMHRAL